MSAGLAGASPLGAVGRSDAGPIFCGRGLVKRFGRVTALDGADFDLYPGEVLAIVGDNGAGKSTMVKILAGVLQPDAGQLYLDGQPVQFHDPIDARRQGVETIYQDLALASALDITTNLFLGREQRRKGISGSLLRRLDKPAMRAESRVALDKLGITTARSVTQAVETLSGGQRQAVAVARAAAWGRRVVIMDEPTAALGVRESHHVLDLVERLRAQGMATVVISHNIPQIFEIADRVHVHRLGRRVAQLGTKTSDVTEVVGIMTGALPPREGSGAPGGGSGASPQSADDARSARQVVISRSDMSALVSRARALAVPGQRHILGVTGAPAAGKSTLASHLADALGPDAVLVPMDGFHLSEDELKRQGTHPRKGAIDTFDAGGYVSLVRRLHGQSEPVVYAPVFRREMEESIAGSIAIRSDVPLVITEGNYLLAGTGEWAALGSLLDEVWYLEPRDEERIERLVQRHVLFGRSPGEAKERALGSDQRNAELIQAGRERADVVVVG